jgi:ubiquinone/menaquinone biosynthesis C-methylase UbiE
MEAKSHTNIVTEQFGSRARAYLESAVHAEGEDLRAVAALLQGAKDARVLDLGCGAGHVSYVAARYAASVVAYDVAPQMLAVVEEEAKRRGLANITTRHGAAEALPFADAGFDFVLSRYSAHHWQNFRAGLQEAARVLKPSGRAIFMDTIAPASPLLDTFLQAMELLRDVSHVRDYTQAEWEAAANAAALTVITTKLGRLRLGFASWISRMNTPPVRAEAIRSLQQAAPSLVQEHFAIEPDGSFTLDTLLLELARSG